MLLSRNEYIKKQAANDGGAIAKPVVFDTQKVLYCNTKFIRDVINCSPIDYDSLMQGPDTDQKRKFTKIISNITEHEVILIPYYPEQTPKSNSAGLTPMLVELHPKDLQATLYMKSGDRITTSTMGGEGTPTPAEKTADMISEEVMKIFENCAKYMGENFDIENVDGGTCEVCVSCEEDYMIAMAYIAECHTYNRAVNLELFNIDRERNKMLDLFLALLNFEWANEKQNCGRKLESLDLNMKPGQGV